MKTGPAGSSLWDGGYELFGFFTADDRGRGGWAANGPRSCCLFTTTGKTLRALQAKDGFGFFSIQIVNARAEQGRWRAGSSVSIWETSEEEDLLLESLGQVTRALHCWDFARTLYCPHRSVYIFLLAIHVTVCPVCVNLIKNHNYF